MKEDNNKKERDIFNYIFSALLIVWFISSIILTIYSPKDTIILSVIWSQTKIIMTFVVVLCLLTNIYFAYILIINILIPILIIFLELALLICFPIPLLIWVLFKENVFAALWSIVESISEKPSTLDDLPVEAVLSGFIGMGFIFLFSILGWQLVLFLWYVI